MRLANSPRLAQLFLLGSLLRNATPVTYYSYPIDFAASGMQVLAQLLGDDSYNNVLDHGCHCAKLDPFSNMKILGGISVMDALDEICRQWNLVRNCNDNLAGGSCLNKDKASITYTIQFSDTDDSLAECAPTDGDHAQCQRDSCVIDLFFAYQVIDYINDFPSFEPDLIVNENACARPTAEPEDKVCNGEAPNFKADLPRANYTEEELEDLCTEAVFDLTILIDGSGSIPWWNFGIALQFIRDLITPFEISPTGGRITLVQFAVDNKVYTTFSDNDVDINNALGQMEWEQMGGQTFTALALETCLEQITTYGRPGVDQFLLVLTDGASTNGLELVDDSNGATYNIAERILSHGVTVFSVGVGSAVSEDELKTIASDPDSTYMYMIDDFGALTDIRLLIVGDVCIRNAVAAIGEVPEPPKGPIYIKNDMPDLDQYPEEVCEACKEGPPKRRKKVKRGVPRGHN